jgi:hypothetical protein
MRALIAVVALILLSILILGCDPQPADGTAGRYHLRERVGNFFDRDMLAARYHMRTRTAKFFGRGAC